MVNSSIIKQLAKDWDGIDDYIYWSKNSINEYNEDGETFIMCLCHHFSEFEDGGGETSYFTIFYRLIDYGSDLSLTSSKGYNVFDILFMSFGYAQKEKLEEYFIFLLEYIIREGKPENKFDINIKNRNNKNLLMLSIYYECTKFALKLINWGIDVTSCDDDENNALMYACQEKNLILIDILINCGIDVNHINDINDFALVECASNRDIECMNKLINYGSIVQYHGSWYVSVLDELINSISTTDNFRFKEKHKNMFIYLILRTKIISDKSKEFLFSLNNEEINKYLKFNDRCKHVNDLIKINDIYFNF